MYQYVFHVHAQIWIHEFTYKNIQLTLTQASHFTFSRPEKKGHSGVHADHWLPQKATKFEILFRRKITSFQGE